MIWKNKIKRTATTTSAILLAIMLTACSDQGNNVSPSPSPSNNINEEQQEEQVQIPNETLPEDTGVLDPGQASNDDDEQKPSTGEKEPSSTDKGQDSNFSESKSISAKGIYVGAADSHSIEIQLEDQSYLVLQVDEDLQYIIDEFPSDQAVTFEYVEKTSEDLGVKQNWLTKIEKK